MSQDLIYPDAVGFDVTAIELGGSGIDLKPGDYQIHDRGSFYELVLGPKSPTTNLPLHSRLDFSAIYFKDGKPLNFEQANTPYLYFTAQWSVATDDKRTVIGPGDGAEMVDFGGHVSNWSPRYQQTKGMDPTLKISAHADEQVLHVQLFVTVPGGVLRDKPLYLPKAS